MKQEQFESKLKKYLTQQVGTPIELPKLIKRAKKVILRQHKL